MATTTSQRNSTSNSLATLTILGRLRGTPKLWLFATLCLFFFAVASAQLSSMRRELAAGDLGFDIQRRPGTPLVGSFDAKRWALHTGDEVVALAGVEIDGLRYFEYRLTLPVGPTTALVRRDGQLIEVTGEVQPIGLITGMALIMRWLTGALLFVLAAGIFLLRPGAKLSWLFFLFLNEVGSIVMIMQGFPVPQAALVAFLGLLFSTTPVLGFHFFALFPQEWPGAKRFTTPLYAIGIGLALIGPLSGSFSNSTAMHIASISRAFTVLMALPMLTAVLYQWRLAKKQGDQRLISVTRTLTMASVGGLFVPLVANTVVRMVGLEGGIAHQITAIAVLIFAVTTAAVLVRHNPLEIDRYAASVVGYVATLGSIGALFVLALFTLPLILRKLGFANSSEALVALTALTFVSVGPVYRRLRRAVDKWFSREQADALQTSDVVRRIADSVQNDSRELAMTKIVDAAMVIGPELVAMWQIDASGRSLHRVLWRNGKPEMLFISREGPIAKALEKAGAVAGLGPTKLPVETQQALWEIELAMTAPVRAHGVPVGFLGVGRRPSGFGYRNEDLSFLETLASQAGLALERGEVVTQIGRYRVEKRLAQGGMAEVFVAWQLGPGGFERKVALKRLLPELAEDPSSAAGLLDEARITARLQHPNIAQVFEVGLEAGQHFIAMEFVDGPPLRTLISNQKRVGLTTPLPISLCVAQGLLSALDHAHTLNDSNGQPLKVVHRDVTPANVLVSLRGETKLVDFGLVMASTRLFRTQTGVARGTVPYMSPEQSKHDETIDLRADVYSAGASLYELFSNERAFPEGPTGAMPVAISKVNSALPAALDAVFAKAFAAMPANRYPTAGAFWEALRAATVPTPLAPLSEVASWVVQHRAQPEFKTKKEEGTKSIAVKPA